jgi:hypothetical protein
MVVPNMTIPDYNITIPETPSQGSLWRPLFEGSWAKPLVFFGKTPPFSGGTRKPLFPEGTPFGHGFDMSEWSFPT